uniref:Uncharacterized protein n=1 Tax=Eubacterium plexicaudatum ASF492 TaxID=1235802 RepID=N1ZVM1_9FIRM
MSEKMITTNECEKCNYSILDETNKAKIIIYCKLKNKKYIYGQRIPCDNKNITS